MANALILWPIRSDVGVTYSPTFTAKASWPSPLPLANVQDRRLHKVARSQGVYESDTRMRCDLGADVSIRGVCIPKASISTAAKWRSILAPSTLLFNYEAGDDITALGGTFTRTPTATVRAASYVDAAGVLRLAGENRCLRSESLDNASWTATSVTVVANAVAAPDGTTTAETLTASGANGTVLQSITETAVSWTFSVWLKRKTGTGTISITANSASSYTTVTLTTEWQRFSVTQTGAAGAGNVGIKIATSADAVWAWGAQAEIGSAATSYLPTTSASVSAPRDAHYPTISGTRGMLIEEARTNICLQSEDFGTTWAAVGTPTRTAAAHTASGVTLDLIGDDDGAALEGYTQTVTFTGNAVKAVSLFVKEGTSTSTMVRLRDTSAAADRLLAAITWSGGLPVITMTTGTGLGYQTLAGSVFRVLLVTTSVTAANTNSLQVYPASDAALATAATGNVYAGGVQCENFAAPSSYIPTTTATVARSPDLLTFPWAGGVPAASTFYVDYVDQGGANIAIAEGADTNLLWLGANGASTAPYLSLLQRAGNGYDSIFHNNNVDAAVSSVASTVSAPTDYGTRCEVAGQLASTGAVQILRTTAGGSFTSHTASGAPATGLAGAWTGTTLSVGMNGGTADANTFVVYSIRVASGAVAGASCRTLVSDSGWLDAWPSGIDAEESEGMNIPMVRLLAANFTARYCSIQIRDTANSAGYLDVGRVVVASGYQPTINLSNGAQIGVDTDTGRERADGGAAYYLERPRFRRLSGTFDDVAETEAMANWLDFMRIAGIHKQFFFVYNPDDTTHMHRRAFLATLERLSPQIMAYLNYSTQAFEIVEEI